LVLAKYRALSYKKARKMIISGICLDGYKALSLLPAAEGAETSRRSSKNTLLVCICAVKMAAQQQKSAAFAVGRTTVCCAQAPPSIGQWWRLPWEKNSS